MDDLKYQPVRHEHDEFLKKAMTKEGFAEAYESLEEEYALVREMIAARLRIGLSQEEIANLMGTTKQTISRLERFGKQVPSLNSLKNRTKYTAR